MAMFLTVLIVPGLKISNFTGAFLAVLGIAFVNSMLWDAALFFFLPKYLSLNSLLLLLTNGAIFWLVVKLAPGIDIKGIAPAIFAPIVFTVCNFFTRKYAADVDWAKVWAYAWENTVFFFSWLRTYFDTVKQTGG